VKYPFYLGESLVATAASRDLRAFMNLAERNFNVIMNHNSQPRRITKLRLASLVSVITRVIYRAGADPDQIFQLGLVCYDQISKLRVDQRGKLKKALLSFCSGAFELIPETITPQPPSLLQRFLQELDQHKAGKLSVNGLAAKLTVSASYLCRVVRAATGRTPSQHLRRAKLTRARALLVSNSVTDTAMESGYNKVSIFIKQFRTEYGQTPGVYRRQLIHGSRRQS
jgi:AraC-like DNA-binding protein